MDQKTIDKFFEKTARVAVHNAVMEKVIAVEREMEVELIRKRDRLRAMLSMEEKYNTYMVSELQQQTADDEFKKNAEKLEKMQNEREMERQQFAEMKRRQQHLLNCQELRPIMCQALLEESKKSQLQQIEERRRLKESEEDEKNMWHEIERRTYEDKLLRERMEQSIRNERNACTVKYLDWQVANKSDGKGLKRRQIEEEKRLNAIKLDEMKRYDAQKKAELSEKQRVFAIDCKRQIEANQNAENERKIRDLNYEKMMLQFDQKESAAAKAKHISDHERRRLEAGHFLEYLEQMRIDKHLTELEEEELMNAYRRKIAEEAYKKRQQLRETQKMLSNEVYAYQLKQINENRERNLRELNEKRQEQLMVQQTHQRNMQIDEAAMLARRQKANESREQLMAQARARELQMEKSKNERVDVDGAQHICDVDDAILLHPNYRQILSFSQK